MSSKVGIHSEIGRLRKVIVHPPGPELLAVTPSTREEFLYDDIIDLDGAAEEHRRFTSILKQYGDVLEVRTLLLETVDIPANEPLHFAGLPCGLRKLNHLPFLVAGL